MVPLLSQAWLRNEQTHQSMSLFIALLLLASLALNTWLAVAPAMLHSSPTRFINAPSGTPSGPRSEGLEAVLLPEAPALPHPSPAPPASPTATPLRGSANWEKTCGSRWQSAYTVLHHDIVTGRAPLRSLVSVAVEKGIADRLSGLMSQFLLALVQRRAILHATYGRLPDWDDAFSFPHIASKAASLDDAILDPVKFTYRGERSYAGLSLANASQYYPLYFVDNHSQADSIFASNLKAFPEGRASVATIVSASNRGRSYVLFDNPYHRSKLRSLGLTPENAFACVHRFMFQLAPVARDATYLEHARVLDDAGEEGALRIAIHVRQGDSAFSLAPNATADWDQASAHFMCAEEIAATRARPGQRVLFYFNSDSLPLRRAAAERYGHRLTTDLRGSGHADCISLGGCDNVKGSFRLAVAQMDLFSRADVHVVSVLSGFGAMGAWMSAIYRHGVSAPLNHSSHIYRVSNGVTRDCSVAAADSARLVASSWAGF